MKSDSNSWLGHKKNVSCLWLFEKSADPCRRVRFIQNVVCYLVNCIGFVNLPIDLFRMSIELVCQLVNWIGFEKEKWSEALIYPARPLGWGGVPGDPPGGRICGRSSFCFKNHIVDLFSQRVTFAILSVNFWLKNLPRSPKASIFDDFAWLLASPSWPFFSYFLKLSKPCFWTTL